MDVPPRSRRRHEYERMRSRALYRWQFPAHTRWKKYSDRPDARLLGTMIATRGPFHSCPHCGANRRKYDGPSMQERKAAGWRDEAWAE